MRKSNQEITDQEIIEEILDGSEICRLAMMDSGRPYILPFNYGYKDRCLYIHSAPEGKKIDLLKADDLVCFEIEHTVRIIKDEKACNWATLYRSVVGYGRVMILTGFEDKVEGLNIIMSQHGAIETFEFTQKEVRRMVILKLKITSVTGKQSSNWNKFS